MSLFNGIPCVVAMFDSKGNAVPVGFTFSYRKAKRLKKQILEVMPRASVSIYEVWNFPAAMERRVR